MAAKNFRGWLRLKGFVAAASGYWRRLGGLIRIGQKYCEILAKNSRENIDTRVRIVKNELGGQQHSRN